MTMTDITLPEVRAHAQSARFYQRGNATLIEIAFVGSKDTSVQKVTPEHMARFKAEWDAFCDGRPPEKRPGLALTELSSIGEARSAEYIARNVHNLEELAALNDGQCQALGHGTMTDRQHARALVAGRTTQERDRLQRELNDKQASVGTLAASDRNAEIEALKADVAEIKALVAGLVSPTRRGRPPKQNKAAD